MPDSACSLFSFPLFLSFFFSPYAFSCFVTSCHVFILCSFSSSMFTCSSSSLISLSPFSHVSSHFLYFWLFSPFPPPSSVFPYVPVPSFHIIPFSCFIPPLPLLSHPLMFSVSGPCFLSCLLLFSLPSQLLLCFLSIPLILPLVSSF